MNKPWYKKIAAQMRQWTAIDFCLFGYVGIVIMLLVIALT
jgi:hypothetical protein